MKCTLSVRRVFYLLHSFSLCPIVVQSVYCPHYIEFSLYSTVFHYVQYLYVVYIVMVM